MSRPAGYTALPNSTPLARLAVSLTDQRVPCAGRTADWYADDPVDRAEAAQACLMCPVLTACDETAEANREQFGVWGGVDRQQVKRKRDRDRAKRDLEPRNAIDHHPTCNRPAPAFRLSWTGQPETACPDCGRYAPIPQPTTKEQQR